MSYTTDPCRPAGVINDLGDVNYETNCLSGMSEDENGCISFEFTDKQTGALSVFKWCPYVCPPDEVTMSGINSIRISNCKLIYTFAEGGGDEIDLKEVLANCCAGGTGGGTDDCEAANVTVSPVDTGGGGNNPPNAVDDARTTAFNTPIPIINVVGNDSDPDGDAISITQINGQAASVGNPITVPNGTATLNADGSISFTPANGYSGTTTFPYTISDGNGGTASADVTVTVDPDGTVTCTPILGISYDPNPLVLDEGDSGIFKLVLVGGNNDGTDVITQNWPMPNWMNGGAVQWNATDGYHVPYTVPPNFFSDNGLASPHDLTVTYTATNTCTTSDPSVTVTITVDNGNVVTEDCALCDDPVLSFSPASIIDSMEGNGGLSYESPVAALNGLHNGARFIGSFINQGGRPKSDTIPGYVGVSGPVVFDRFLPHYVIFPVAGHQPNLNTGVMLTEARCLARSKATGLFSVVQTRDWSIHFSDLFIQPYVVTTGHGTADGTVGDCKWQKFNPTIANGPGDGVVGHGWSGFIGLDPDDWCGVIVQTKAKLCCIDPNGPDDRALARYQMTIGGDYIPTDATRPNLQYYPAAGASRGKLITSNWQTISFGSLDNPFELDPTGVGLECYVMTDAELDQWLPANLRNW